MALEKMRSQACFLLPYHQEQVASRDNSATVISPGQPANRKIIKQQYFHVGFK